MSQKNRTVIGLVMAMAAILMLHNNNVFIGLPLFVAGIFLMIRKKKK